MDVSRYPAAGKCFQKTRYPAVRNFDQKQCLKSLALSVLNNVLVFLLKVNEVFHVNWTRTSDCRASSILKTVPVSQDSK